MAAGKSIKTGAKVALKNWMSANLSEWKGDTPLSPEAKLRITTVANWKKKGGAPKTGGS